MGTRRLHGEDHRNTAEMVWLGELLFGALYVASARLRYVTIASNDIHAAAMTAGNKTVVTELSLKGHNYQDIASGEQGKERQ